jgi:hypothetical protein
MLTAKLVTTDEELIQIAELSAANLSSNISDETKAKEGFLSWFYPVEALRAIHAIVPSVIVKEGETVAGYALTLTRECVAVYPPMAPTIAHLSRLRYKNRLLNDSRLYLMGQICVRQGYRGQGTVGLLYEFHKQEFSSQYDMLITEISPTNPRSLKAHEKAGFRIIDTYRDEQKHKWIVVLWDWNT